MHGQSAIDPRKWNQFSILTNANIIVYKNVLNASLRKKESK